MFKRYGRAVLAHVDMAHKDWLDAVADGVRRAARPGSPRSRVATAESLTAQCCEILGRPFDPKEFVLSHATLVASVDTYAPKTAKVGRTEVEGFSVNCPFPDYRVTLATQKYANNNNDAFSRGTLLKSYRTLVGGQVFVEHVQIEALSKGRIFDAVARDVGGSVYVDILAGTHRDHEDLCAGILAGSISKMSMGCDIAGAQCAKCGNWSADDTTVCPCVQYFKGDVFQDEEGNPHRVVELCGHESLPGGGVTFKEGSWVGMPAFEGAVARGLVQVPGTRHRTAPPVHTDLRQLVAGSWIPVAGGRTASRSAQDPVEFEGVGGEGESSEPPEDPGAEEAPGETPETPDSSKSPLDDSVTQVEQWILDQALDRVKQRMRSRQVEEGLPLSTAPNSSILHQAATPYRAALRQIAARAKSPASRLLALHHLNQALSVPVPERVYRSAATAVRGGRTASVSDFISSCLSGAGSALTPSEAKTLVRVARFLLRGDA